MLRIFRRNVVVHEAKGLEELQLRVHRLEIQQLQLMEVMEQNGRLYSKLLKRLDGELGGRPKHDVRSNGLPPIIPGQPYPHHRS